MSFHISLVIVLQHFFVSSEDSEKPLDMEPQPHGCCLLQQSKQRSTKGGYDCTCISSSVASGDTSNLPCFKIGKNLTSTATAANKTAAESKAGEALAVGALSASGNKRRKISMRDLCRHVKYTLADILEDGHEENDNTLLPDDEKAKAESYMMASSTIILPRRPYIVSFFFSFRFFTMAFRTLCIILARPDARCMNIDKSKLTPV